MASAVAGAAAALVPVNRLLCGVFISTDVVAFVFVASKRSSAYIIFGSYRSLSQIVVAFLSSSTRIGPGD